MPPKEKSHATPLPWAGQNIHGLDGSFWGAVSNAKMNFLA
jgi:hypothetical protein